MKEKDYNSVVIDVRVNSLINKLMKKEGIEEIKKRAEELAGCWNGDEAGIQEEQASIAKEISEKCDELLALIDELNG